LNTVQQEIMNSKIIAIIRSVTKFNLLNTADALYKGGVRLIEVTFNQASASGTTDTAEAIELLNCEYEDKMCIGAGTVMNLEQLRAAVDAGAKYIISPNTNIELIKKTVELGVVSIPGAYTPSEIASAYDAGANFVKIFPAGQLGPKYIKAIRAPINHIPLIAVGNINENNINDFLQVGVAGFGIGSNIVNKKLINEGRFDELTKLAEIYTKKIKEWEGL